jgi:hypothetical protein
MAKNIDGRGSGAGDYEAPRTLSNGECTHPPAVNGEHGAGQLQDDKTICSRRYGNTSVRRHKATIAP